MQRVGTLILLAAAIPIVAETIAPLPNYTAAERRHWAFQNRSRPPVPTFTEPADKRWVRNDIDAFILARLNKEGLKPAPEASRRTLIRRLSYDLTGLPPTPAEVAAFVRDPDPKAYEKLVDKLLASRAYGERQGQQWLDVVRFSETDGFEYDTHRNGAWRYRDYVIDSFNEDKPYDRFIREQLAGDEIAPNDHKLLIASGFQRLGPLRKNAGNQEVASSRNEVMTEMTNIVGAALLGVTLGCARCHDHKFDPIRQSDYYRIQAYFAATQENDVPLAPLAEQEAWKAKKAAIDEELKELKKKVKGLQGDELKQLQEQIKQTEARIPEPLPALFAVKNEAEKASPVHLLGRGDYHNKGARVGMRPMGILVDEKTPEITNIPENPRTRLAEWITDPNHPLTARVWANRAWGWHFSRSLVTTPNDFGRMGTRPSHPELLDYLANSFVDNGWSIKKLHRLILTSATYRQSSTADPAVIEKDPENKFLARYSRRRLQAEEIRDSMISVSGKLNPKTGGPGVMVPVDKGLIDLMYKPEQWQVAADPEEHNRRSIYLIAKRNIRLPFMEVFDAPDGQTSCARRESSTHPPQALELLNGDLANRLAESFAARLTKEAGASKPKQVTLAYRLAAGRDPSPKELKLGTDFLAAQPAREFALAIFNLNSFLYVE